MDILFYLAGNNRSYAGLLARAPVFLVGIARPLHVFRQGHGHYVDGGLGIKPAVQFFSMPKDHQGAIYSNPLLGFANVAANAIHIILCSYKHWAHLRIPKR